MLLPRRDVVISNDTHCSPLPTAGKQHRAKAPSEAKLCVATRKHSFHSQSGLGLPKPDYRFNFVTLSGPYTTKHTAAGEAVSLT